mgnify:CR=1 FL=1
MRIFSFSVFLLSLSLAFSCSRNPSTVPPLVDIPSGEFLMGSGRGGYFQDEAPVHKVTISRSFRMGVTPVTNAQFELFMPSHKDLRGSEWGLSTGDDEAVVCVSYEDALAYCRWLSRKTGRKFRLPTEAEWEYACRAGSVTPFNTGESLPMEMQLNQKTERDLVKVSLEVGRHSPNAFGLHDMHSLVEEWCLDWYGPYSGKDETDPAGPLDGEYRVTRGGSHNTPSDYLTSSAREAAIPSDSHSQIGFRIVEAPSPKRSSFSKPVPGSKGMGNTAALAQWRKAEGPLFMEPVPFVVPPLDSGTPFYSHNHQPAVTWCDNGDLLAIWFSTDAESGREMVVLSSRLPYGFECWTPSELFFKVPSRNMTGSSLLHLPDGRLLHVNGVSNSGDWQNLALSSRISTDGGFSWSSPVLSSPLHRRRHQVISGPIVLSDGTIAQMCDAGAGSNDGAAIQLSGDSGMSFYDPWDGSPLPVLGDGISIEDGGKGTTVAGIHAGIVELANGDLLCFGRGNPIVAKDGPYKGRRRMPMSLSHDRGKSWEYSASPFPPIDGGQRLVLLRLREGPLMLASFSEHPERTPEPEKDFTAETPSGEKVIHGIFVALSYDEGKSWPIRRLLSDGSGRTFDGGAWTGEFVMDSQHSEPKGYFAGVQTPDGVIHLLSSRLHYRFNLEWIENGFPASSEPSL